MNRHTIEKESLEKMVSLTVDKNPDVRLHRSKILGTWDRKPLQIVYQGRSSVAIRIDIDIRFGLDMMKVIDKISNEIRGNFEKLAKVTVKSLQLKVKDIFDEEKSV